MKRYAVLGCGFWSQFQIAAWQELGDVELSYASKVEHDRFPETFVLIEGEKGSIELGPDYWLKTTTGEGTLAVRIEPPFYP